MVTSEQYRLDYFCGCYTSSWPGTLREQEYLNGPLPMETVTKPNDDVINYIRSNFIAEDGIVRDINSIRNYFSNDGQCSDGIVIGIYKTNNDPNYVRSHAVIIKSKNGNNLYIHDPQTGYENLQTEFDGLYNDSKFLYGIKITGLAE